VVNDKAIARPHNPRVAPPRTRLSQCALPATHTRIWCPPRRRPPTPMHRPHPDSSPCPPSTHLYEGDSHAICPPCCPVSAPDKLATAILCSRRRGPLVPAHLPVDYLELHLALEELPEPPAPPHPRRSRHTPGRTTADLPFSMFSSPCWCQGAPLNLAACACPLQEHHRSLHRHPFAETRWRVPPSTGATSFLCVTTRPTFPSEYTSTPSNSQ
jgi:hypothetical protein